jgi:acetolactate synthase I/II/III large subunit
MKKKVSDIVADFLVQKKLNNIFGVTGGGAMHLNDSFAKNKKLNFIFTHHEQSAAMAADSYFREKGNPAVIHTTSGPGGTNAITGVIGAWIDSIPAFIISGQVPKNQMINKTSTRQIGVQEANIIDLVKKITKYSITVKNSKDIFNILEDAYQLMHEGKKGPVWIDIPLNIQGEKIKINKNKKKNKIFNKNKTILKAKINDKKFLSLLSKSKKPLIFIGNGIHISNSKNLFHKFINKVKCPIISSWNAIDLINNSDERYLGRSGLFGDRPSNLAAQACDLMIILGTRLSIPQIGYLTKDFGKKANKIIIDIDEKELNKNLLSNVKLKINCDLKNFFLKINSVLGKKNFYFQNWLKLTNSWKKNYPVFDKKKISNNSKLINSFNFINSLSETIPANSSVITDMGTSFTCTMQTFKIKNHKKQRIYTASGLSAMGYGLPGAIGASFANDKKKIICVSGDGGLMFNLQELQTIKHYKLPVKIFVLENKGYLTMKLMQKKNFKKLTGSDDTSGVTIPNLEKIAKAFELKYIKIKNSKLNYQLKNIFKNNTPSLIEVNMPKLQPLIPRLQAELQKNGQFKKLEFDNMYPHLPREILELERLKAKLI